MKSTSKTCMLVFVKLSEKYTDPPGLALLYDFVNSLDQRRYIENGVAHPALSGADNAEAP